MADPLVSIVIPTFNSASQLKLAIGSILEQTSGDFEILIVDGLSTDETVQVAGSYNDKRIKIHSGKDNGIYDAMNKGINQASGKWLYFLGSDDRLYHERVLETISTVLSTTASEMVYGNVKMNGDTRWAADGAVYDGVFTVEKLFQRNICHQAIFYSKRVFQKLGCYNTEYGVCADWDFNHRCFAACKVEYVDEIIALFRGGGKSSSGKPDKYSREDSVINLKAYYKRSHFDPLFKSYTPVFQRLWKLKLREKKITRSVYFLTLSIWHGKNRIGTLKEYGSALLKSFKSS